MSSINLESHSLKRQLNWREWLLLVITTCTLFFQIYGYYSKSKQENYKQFEMSYTLLMTRAAYYNPGSISRLSDDEFTLLREEAFHLARTAPKDLEKFIINYAISITDYRIACKKGAESDIKKTNDDMFKSGINMRNAMQEYSWKNK